uniref:T9SS type A sorting domain-containing protein n=1 Tax=Cloacibacterium sp. TaxID=1913682 RepID=UPI0035B2FB5E
LPIAAAWTKYTAKMPAEATATSLDVAFRAYGGQTTSYDDILAYEEGTLATIDPKTFDKKVKMNTLVSDKLILQLPSRSTVNIYSVEGKLISSDRVNDGDSINVSSLQKGAYIVTVQDNYNNKLSRKIIKQ